MGENNLIKGMCMRGMVKESLTPIGLLIHWWSDEYWWIDDVRSVFVCLDSNCNDVLLLCDCVLEFWCGIE